MRTSFSWLFIPSLTLSLPFSLSSATTNLSSQNSFNGTGTFSPTTLNDSTEDILNFLGDVSISNAGSGTALSASCFGQTQGNFTLQGNGFSLSFNSITAQNSVDGVAISSTAATPGKVLSLLGFSNLFFTLSPPASGGTGKGAVNSTGSALLQGNKNVIFFKNATTDNGGALHATGTVTCTNNSSLSFQQNTATTNGGALYTTGEVILSDTSGSVTFIGNSAALGGALYCQGNGFITNNFFVSFDGNTTKSTGNTNGNGGAIYCSQATPTQPPQPAPTTPAPVLTISGNQYVNFLNNSATSNGGAIYTNQLVLSAGGPTLFQNNTVTNDTTAKGGAIAIADNGVISLSADSGDITFSGNKTITGTAGSQQTTTRNAIDLGNAAAFSQLRASAGNTIFFYDPITSSTTQAQAPTPPALKINGPDTTNNPSYQGTIVFSGEQLSTEEAARAENLKSTIKQNVELSGGSLVLKQGVTLVASSFTQQSSSSLIMDTGTTLESEGDLTVTNLTINVASLAPNKQATLKAGTSNKINLSGALTLSDPTGSAYENLMFDKDATFSFLSLEANTTETTGLSLTPSSPEGHYGYQGTWSLTLGSGQNPQAATLSWVKSGYTPNPQRVTSLVPNSLWGSYSDMRAFQSVLETCCYHEHDAWQLWGAGIANFLHRDHTATNRQYHHTSVGYVLGASRSLSSQTLVSLAFGGLYGNDKDRFVAQNHATIYGGSLYLQHVGQYSPFRFFFNKLLSEKHAQKCIFKAQLSYSYADNSLTTRYTFAPKVQGSWSNDCLAAELISTFPMDFYKGVHGFYSFSPIAKAEVIYAHQKDFKESGNDGRHFASSDLLNFSLPIGLTFERKLHAVTLHTTLLYVGDVYRRNPHGLTTLIQNNASWETFGTNLARQAFIARAGAHLAMTQNCEIFSKCAFELRSSSRTYNVHLGGKLFF
ncbi:autotransporter domain-containing protein [Chlamydia pecorum]|uniref:autotransporter domain-containing protein n=1 Tax=Chlamydia pecorum TaxID=85991 RepID=UPI0007AF28B4|nr:autotransporter domain-containing protein [Chlamydia pecorum]KZN26809.1 autotransporter beta-domain protein [Chlamydia pecorum]